jgi:transposase
MATPYSLDLRRKVVQACQRPGQSQRAVAEFFGVSLSFVEGLLRRVRRSGELVPLRRRPGPHPKVDEDACQRLERWLQEQPDLTLAELAERLQADGCPVVSTPTVCRALQRLGLRRKKRPYTPQNAMTRRYVRHAANTGRTLPGMPRRG